MQLKRWKKSYLTCIPVVIHHNWLCSQYSKISHKQKTTFWYLTI